MNLNEEQANIFADLSGDEISTIVLMSMSSGKDIEDITLEYINKKSKLSSLKNSYVKNLKKQKDENMRKKVLLQNYNLFKSMNRIEALNEVIEELKTNFSDDDDIKKLLAENIDTYVSDKPFEPLFNVGENIMQDNNIGNHRGIIGGQDVSSNIESDIVRSGLSGDDKRRNFISGMPLNNGENLELFDAYSLPDFIEENNSAKLH